MLTESYATRPRPVISVLLPVYNGAAYLAAAIDGILHQTFRDFELIIIDDGSRDHSVEIINGYSDSRIRFFAQDNRGLAATLNRGIELATGKYIARQDQDDISRPERFAEQSTYLEKHPACAMVGSWADIWREGGPTGRTLRHPSEDALIKLELLFDNPFVHTSMMLRRECLLAVGGYSTDPARQPPEDYELWSRMARRWDVANIPEALVIYREVAGSMSRSKDRDFWDRVVTIRSENMQMMLEGRCDADFIREVVRFALNVRPEPPDVRRLAGMMNELANVMGNRHPDHRRKIRSRLKIHYFGMLAHRFRRNLPDPVAFLMAHFCIYRFFR